MARASAEELFQRWARLGAPWGGSRTTVARGWLAERVDWPAPCGRCGGGVDRVRWQLGHTRSRDTHPWLTWEPGNWRVEHVRCNTSAGASAGNRKRRSYARARGVPAFSDARAASTPPSFPFVSEPVRSIPQTLSNRPRPPGDRDGLPSFFSPPHPRAVGSRGDEFVEWVERETNTQLRWWQWLTAQRRYEVDEDGAWCWLRFLTSLMRQLGKSVELARDAAWTGSQEEPTGLILQAAHRVTTSRDVQAELWPWAYANGLGVAQQLGDSRITWPSGSVWRTIAMESAYGQRPFRLLVDESWAMDPIKFWNSLWPALSGRETPVQAGFWSAANPEDKGLVHDLRADPDVCRMEWGALPGEDLADPRVWRLSHPYWPEGREKLIAPAVGKPGFAENFLNVWPETATWRWLPKTATDRAAAIRVPRLPPTSAECGVECSLDGQRWAVAAAWSDRRGTAVRVWAAESLEDCLRIAGDRAVRAHRAIVELAPKRERWRMTAVEGPQLRAATGALREAVRSGSLRMAGIPDEQWQAVQVSPADGGETIDARRSSGDVQSVKAAAVATWAVISELNPGGFLFGAPADDGPAR